MTLRLLSKSRIATQYILLAFVLFWPYLAYSQTNAHSKTNLAEREVYAGVHLIDIAKIDLRDGTFEANFLLWVRWAGNPKDVPLIQIVNGNINVFEETRRETMDGWNSIRWKVQGTFRTRFSVVEFPFDRHIMEIRLRFDKRKGKFVPDLAASGAEPSFSASGWVYEPYFEARNNFVKLTTDLGSVHSEGQARNFEELSFTLTMQRPWLSVALRYLPLAIVIIVAGIAMLTPPRNLEVGSGLIVTSLLASIAFYFAEVSFIPDVAYLTRAHYAFLGAYTLIGTALILTFVTFFLRRWKILANAIGVVSFVGIIASLVFGTWWFIRPLPPEIDAFAYASKEVNVTKKRPVSTRNKVAVSYIGFKKNLSWSIQNNILRRGLFSYDENGNLIPHLVNKLPSMTNELVRFLPDGRMRVIWQLKPGLKWGDGTPIQAEDLIIGQRYTHKDTILLNILDPLTVEAIYPDRSLKYIKYTSILPHRIFGPIFDNEGRQAVTNRLKTAPPPLDGPYILKSLTPNKEIILVRNPHYIGRTPILEQIHFINPGSTEKYIKALNTGDLHVGVNNSPETFAKFVDRPDLAKERFKIASFFRLALDVTQPPFDNAKVRKALTLAMNRTRLSFDGNVPVAYRLPKDEDFAPYLVPVEHDPEKAKRLLSEAGYPDGLEIKLHIWKPRLALPEHKKIKQIEADFAKAGIRVKRVIYDDKTPKQHGGALWRLTNSTQDREGWFWNLPYSEMVEGRVAFMRKSYGDRIARLWETFETSPYKPRRITASQKLQALFVKQQPSILITHEDRLTVRASTLQGWRPTAVSFTKPYWNIEDWYFAEESSKTANKN